MSATITLVVTTACHLCEDAKEALEELSAEFGFSVRLVDAASAEGWALLGRYRPGLLPLAILDGETFSAGRLPRKKLRRVLEHGAVPA